MIYTLTFTFELILLFFISKKLINSLAQTFFRFTKSHRTVVNILAVLFLPGTIIHELSHLLVAGVMLVPVGEIDVLPQIQEKGVKLGSVQIGQTDPLRRTVIGVAPVLVGIGSILGILYFAQNGNEFIFWQFLLNLYLIFQIGNTMFSSKKDFEGIIGFLVAILSVVLIVIIALYFAKPEWLQQIWSYLSSLQFEPVVNFFKKASLYLLIPLSLDLIIILLAYPVIYKR